MKKIGRQVLLLEADSTIARIGEGSFIGLNDGSIMFGFTEFTQGNEDEDCAHISAIVSRDGGETWSPRSLLFTKSQDAVNIMSLSFLKLKNGDIGAFYIEKRRDGTNKILFTRSSDEAKNWSAPVNCIECLHPDYYVLNNSRVIQLQNGRILLPLARHTIYGTNSFPPGDLCFVYSDDDGKTWSKTAAKIECPFPNDPNGFQEPGLYELADGRIMCYIRTGLGFQFECFSEDYGETWSTPCPNTFFSSPCSPMLVTNACNLAVAIFNPIPEHVLREDDEEFWGRTPYTIAVSTDRAETFSRKNLYYLEDDLSNGYCYPAVYDSTDYALIAYYHSNNTDCCLNSTKIIKISPEELVENFTMTYEERKAQVKAYLGKKVKILMDRPLGYVHKKEAYTLVYPINYGYIPGVLGGDGEELDVYLMGVNEPVEEYECHIIAIVHRHNDVEDKLVAAPCGVTFTREEIEKAVHFQEQYYDSEIEINE